MSNVIILFKSENVVFVFIIFQNEMITNINYIVKAVEPVDHLPFRNSLPQMYVHKTQEYTLILFKSGQGRLMGCKQPLTKRLINVVVNVAIQRINSASVTFNVGQALNLTHLGNYCHHNSVAYQYEPELFPALRLSSFNPLCVNVFSSGKCVILGLKHLCYHKFVRQIMGFINTSGCTRPVNHAITKAIVREDGVETIQRHTAEAQGL